MKQGSPWGWRGGVQGAGQSGSGVTAAQRGSPREGLQALTSPESRLKIWEEKETRPWGRGLYEPQGEDRSGLGGPGGAPSSQVGSNVMQAFSTAVSMLRSRRKRNSKK